MNINTTITPVYGFSTTRAKKSKEDAARKASPLLEMVENNRNNDPKMADKIADAVRDYFGITSAEYWDNPHIVDAKVAIQTIVKTGKLSHWIG